VEMISDVQRVVFVTAQMFVANRTQKSMAAVTVVFYVVAEV